MAKTAKWCNISANNFKKEREQCKLQTLCCTKTANKHYPLYACEWCLYTCEWWHSKYSGNTLKTVKDDCTLTFEWCGFGASDFFAVFGVLTTGHRYHICKLQCLWVIFSFWPLKFCPHSVHLLKCTMWGKKTAQFYFCNDFAKPSYIKIIVTST